jgi:hypothetical protein
MRALSAEQNAREEGRDCALAWPGLRAHSEETCQEWRERFRSTIARQFESGEGCSLCQADATREEFLHLLAEWDQGFDRTMNVMLGSPADRAAEIKRIASRASAMCSLLGVTNIIPDEDKLSTLRTCAHIADDIVGDLSVLIGGVA